MQNSDKLYMCVSVRELDPLLSFKVEVFIELLGVGQERMSSSLPHHSP